MPRLWPWLRRLCGRSAWASAPLRTPRSPSARIAFETLEDRFLPSTLIYQKWRQQRFRVDDAVLAAANRPAVAAAAVQGNQSFGPLVGLDRAFGSTPYRGTGYSVAVLDTGIDYTHPDLGGGWGRRVVGGYDFHNRDANPMDDNGHGTHVAGIIGSSSATFSGVAPNVNLVALKVLGSDGSGSFGAVEDALRWVLANQARYNIVAINLSLGSGNYTVNPYSFLEDEFTGLKNLGVFLSVAAGNSFYSFNSAPGLDFPAISPSVVSVGAVWAGNFGSVGWASGARDHTTAPDRVASFSQRGTALSLLAPGAMINSTYLGGRYRQMAGTSMAAPVVAGAAVLLHQALDATGRGVHAHQTYLYALMRETGAYVVDGDDENDNVTNTGLTFRRLDVAAALNAALQTPAQTNRPPTFWPPAEQRLTPGGSVTIGLSATDPDGDAITYSARVVGQDAGAAQRWQLRQSLGLAYLGSFHTNSWGQNEHWIGGSGGTFYGLLPSGELRRWTGTVSGLLSPENLIANVGPEVYAAPWLLYDAKPASAPLTAALSGNQLTLTAAASGSYQVEVSANDGRATVTRTFTVIVNAAPPANRAPTLSMPASVAAAAGAMTVSVPLTAADPDGDALTITAALAGGQSAAYQFRQSLDLTYAGSYFLNIRGLNEKWLVSRDGTKWYCLLPGGELRRFASSAAEILVLANLVATLGAEYYQDPGLLLNAASGVRANVSVANGQVTVSLLESYRGTLQLEVTVSDGRESVRRTTAVTFA